MKIPYQDNQVYEEPKGKHTNDAQDQEENNAWKGALPSPRS